MLAIYNNLFAFVSPAKKTGHTHENTLVNCNSVLFPAVTRLTEPIGFEWNGLFRQALALHNCGQLKNCTDIVRL